MFKSELEKPMTREEMDHKIQAMMAERQRQDLEMRRFLGNTSHAAALRFQSVQEKSMTREEIDSKMREMLAERQRQDLEARKRSSPTPPYKAYLNAYRATYNQDPPPSGMPRSILTDPNYKEALNKELKKS